MSQYENRLVAYFSYARPEFTRQFDSEKYDGPLY